jgi:hypothetical protein
LKLQLKPPKWQWNVKLLRWLSVQMLRVEQARVLLQLLEVVVEVGMEVHLLREPEARQMELRVVQQVAEVLEKGLPHISTTWMTMTVVC